MQETWGICLHMERKSYGFLSIFWRDWNCPYHDVQSDKIIPTYVMCINSHITCFINSMHHANKNENGNQELSHYKEQ